MIGFALVNRGSLIVANKNQTETNPLKFLVERSQTMYNKRYEESTYPSITIGSNGKSVS